MKKFVEIRTKIDLFLLKTAASLVLIAAVVSNKWIVGLLIEPVMEAIEDFCWGPLDMMRSTSENIAELIVLYAVIVGVDRMARFAISYISKLMTRNRKKKTEETSE